MKIKIVNKICNLEKNIELLKKKILEVQIKKLGELTYENLKKMDFANIDFSDTEKETTAMKIKKENLMDLLKTKEDEYNEQLKMNTDNEHTNNKLKEKYDKEKQKKQMKKEYVEKLNKINGIFNEEKKILDETVIKLKQEREHKLHIKQLHDDKIVFLLDKIRHFTDHNNSIRKNIRDENKQIKALHKACNNEIRKYQIEHRKKYKELCGGGNNNNNNNNNLKICKNKMKKWDMKKLDCKLFFMEKYNIYLGEFYELCEKYGEKENGIVKECITFTREQVQNKIDELIENTEKLKKSYYEEMDESYLKTDYEGEIEKLENEYKLKIEKREKEIKTILDSVKNVIEQYKKKKKIKSRKEIMEYMDDLKKQKLDLEFKNEDLELKYKELIKLKMNIKPNCLERLNIIKADSLKEIYTKKKECAEI